MGPRGLEPDAGDEGKETIAEDDVAGLPAVGETDPPVDAPGPPGKPGLKVEEGLGAVGPRDSVTGQMVVYCGIVIIVTTVEASGQLVTEVAQEITVDS